MDVWGNKHKQKNSDFITLNWKIPEIFGLIDINKDEYRTFIYWYRLETLIFLLIF